MQELQKDPLNLMLVHFVLRLVYYMLRYLEYLIIVQLQLHMLLILDHLLVQSPFNPRSIPVFIALLVLLHDPLRLLAGHPATRAIDGPSGPANL